MCTRSQIISEETRCGRSTLQVSNNARYGSLSRSITIFLGYNRDLITAHFRRHNVMQGSSSCVCPGQPYIFLSWVSTTGGQIQLILIFCTFAKYCLRLTDLTGEDDRVAIRSRRPIRRSAWISWFLSLKEVRGHFPHEILVLIVT